MNKKTNVNRLLNVSLAAALLLGLTALAPAPAEAACGESCDFLSCAGSGANGGCIELWFGCIETQSCFAALMSPNAADGVGVLEANTELSAAQAAVSVRLAAAINSLHSSMSSDQVVAALQEFPVKITTAAGVIFQHEGFPATGTQVAAIACNGMSQHGPAAVRDSRAVETAELVAPPETTSEASGPAE